MRFSYYERLTHDIDLSCVHGMLSINVRSQCYISITHAQHIINLFIDLTWHIQTLGRWTSVPTSLIYHGLKFINQNNVVHQLRYYHNSALVSNKQSKSTTNNLSRTWWGHISHHDNCNTMDVGMTVLRWFLTVQKRCIGTNFMCWYNDVHQLRYYLIADPSMFTSSDISISRILPPTNKADWQSTICHFWYRRSW